MHPLYLSQGEKQNPGMASSGTAKAALDLKIRACFKDMKRVSVNTFKEIWQKYDDDGKHSSHSILFQSKLGVSFELTVKRTLLLTEAKC